MSGNGIDFKINNICEIVHTDPAQIVNLWFRYILYMFNNLLPKISVFENEIKN